MMYFLLRPRVWYGVVWQIAPSFRLPWHTKTYDDYFNVWAHYAGGLGFQFSWYSNK